MCSAMSHKQIVMLGTDWRSPGGMTAVIHQYHAAGLWQQWPILYLATFHHDRLGNKLKLAASAALRLLGLLLRGRVALVHAHGAVYGSFWRKGLLLMLARLFGVPTIFHLHGGEFVHFYETCCGPRRRWLVRYLLRHMGVICVLSQRWADLLQTVEPACKPEIVPNPIGLPAQAAQPQAGRLLFLGRLRDVKGVYELITALSLLRERFPHLRLVLGGDGDQAPLWAHARAQGVADMIEMPGWIDGDAKASALREAEVFVLPSHYEAQPVCILEAMAQGVPVVATSVGGIPDMCDDGVHALLVPAQQPEQLAAAIGRLLDNAELRQTLARQAYQRVVAQYSHQQVMQQLGQLYQSLGAQPGISLREVKV